MTPQPRRAGLLFLALSAILAAGCGGGGVTREGDPAVEVTLRLSPTPPMAGEAAAAVRVTDGGAPAPPGTRVSAVVEGPDGTAWTLAYREAGRWEGPVTFPDPGSAHVVVSVALPDGRWATFRFPVTVTRRPGA